MSIIGDHLRDDSCRGMYADPAKTGQHTLELFRSLTKSGAVWHGDVISRNWGECLYIDNPRDYYLIMQVLSRYTSGVDYKLVGDNEIWI